MQWRSTPWSVAWHVVECLDFDLTGGFASWDSPLPFAGTPHWLLTTLPRAWTRSEIVGYIDYCRQRVVDVLRRRTEERGRRHCLLPIGTAANRTLIITGALGHTVEHGSQIRQYVNGVAQGEASRLASRSTSPEGRNGHDRSSPQDESVSAAE